MKKNHSDEPSHSDSHQPHVIENVVIKEFADLISQSICSSEIDYVDPAEVYVFELKTRLVKDTQTFRNKFFRGYLSLMDVLSKDHH